MRYSGHLQLTTHLYLTARLNAGTTPAFPHVSFMACWLIRDRVTFTFPLQQEKTFKDEKGALVLTTLSTVVRFGSVPLTPQAEVLFAVIMLSMLLTVAAPSSA